MPDWNDVLVAVTAPPKLTVRGRIAEVRRGDDDDEDLGRPEVDVLVWRDGPRLRVDTPDGRPVFRSDGHVAWDFRTDRDRPDTRRVDERLGMPYFGPHQMLLSRSRMEWLSGDDFASPAGPVTEGGFAGRPCWTVDLAPPPRKPHPVRIWVDVEAGQMLRFWNEAAGIGAEFAEVAVGEVLDPGLFTWDGPAITQDERQAMLSAESRALAAGQQEWFAENVTPHALRTRVPVDFTPEHLHFHDPETGSFDAGSAEGRVMLARRPRATEQWTPGWGAVSAHVWSTPDWDWAAGTAYLSLDEEAVAELRELLHPGEPVDRARRLS